MAGVSANDDQDRAVPIAVAVSGPRREQVSRVVEGALGWPVVAIDDTVLPPAALLCDVGSLPAEDPAGLHVVLLVGPDDDAVAAVAASRRADRVLSWPPTAASVGAAVLGQPSVRGRRPWCTVAGSAGGVGATTVALALAGIRAWRSGRTLVATSGPSHVADAPAVRAADLASPAAWAAGAAVTGLDPLRAVALRPAPHPPAVGEVATVVDVGCSGVVAGAEHGAATPSAGVDVLVIRADRAGLDALASGTGRAAVVAGRGPATPADLRAACGDRIVVEVAEDARVARACHAHRHPTDAPGRWLRPLEPLVALLGQSPHPGGPA